MNITRGLLTITLLVVGILLGTRLTAGRVTDITGAMRVRAGEMLDLRAARVDKHSGQDAALMKIVRLVEPEANENLLAAVGAATRLPLMLEDEQVFLPMLRR